jgi:UDPglucose--hexose-1-phosphate uridylyltransferase
VSPHRTKRPWQGQTEPAQLSTLPRYDPECYLCPGNARAGGQRNESYEHTYVFDNDYAAVLPPPEPLSPPAPHPLLTVDPVQGGCDVLVFHPRHDLTLARLAQSDILRVIEEWVRVYRKRGAQEETKYVQIFEVSPVFICSVMLPIPYRFTSAPEQRCYDGLLQSPSSWPGVVTVSHTHPSCHGA